MRPIRAAVFFRTLAALFGLGGVLLTWAAWRGLGALGGWPELDWRLALGGGLLLAIGLAGPGRVIAKGLQIPLEVRSMVLVLAVSFPAAGAALLAAGTFGGGWVRPGGLVVAGACALAVSLAGFLRLSGKLPATFYLHEMAAIIKSAGIFGKKTESAADREFRRWSGGVRRGVGEGQPAPDGAAVTMAGKTTRLAEFFGAEGSSPPLVLNFGSYTCPHHRKRIGELHGLMDKWQGRGVRFLTVYTAEAHPEDGWRLENQYDQDSEYTGDAAQFCFYYAKTIAERLAMARWLVDKKDFRMPIVLDSMENTLLTAYNSWPIRLYIINGGRVAFCGKQGPFGYAPAEVDAALGRMLP